MTVSLEFLVFWDHAILKSTCQVIFCRMSSIRICLMFFSWLDWGYISQLNHEFGSNPPALLPPEPSWLGRECDGWDNPRPACTGCLSLWVTLPSNRELPQEGYWKKKQCHSREKLFSHQLRSTVWKALMNPYFKGDLNTRSWTNNWKVFWNPHFAHERHLSKSLVSVHT